MDNKQNLLRALPQVNEILNNPKIASLCNEFPREVLVDRIREEIGSLRSAILQGIEIDSCEGLSEGIVKKVIDSMQDDSYQSLIPVINATGVVLHTNLGRSLLCERAVKDIEKVAASYTNLEYDIENGKRGSRHDHVEKLITQITGAQAAMVVNNNAAATLLVLSAIGKGREIVTSRGELVEIGGSFRVPEIMEQGGAVLKEVGTTNRTRARDYTNAYKEGKTAAFLKVHTSNYRIVGFTEETPLEDIVKLAHERHIPAIYDMGSGLFCDLSRYGVDEPTIPKVIETGVDVLLFSGDKLLGGTQAGIIVGKKEYIDMFKAHPLARALRVDKLTIAGLCSTLYEYRDPKTALKRIPTLKMISYSKEELLTKAENLCERLRQETDLNVFIEDCKDQVGGGSAPGILLDGYIVCISGYKSTTEEAEKKLRLGDCHVLCRMSHDNICFSVRTLQDGQEELIAKVVKTL